MLESSTAPDAVHVANAPAGATTLALLQPPGGLRRDDYAWTHGTAVEGFFVLLTAVVVPVAIVRWTRRLRAWSPRVARRRGDLRT